MLIKPTSFGIVAIDCVEFYGLQLAGNQTNHQLAVSASAPLTNMLASRKGCISAFGDLTWQHSLATISAHAGHAFVLLFNIVERNPRHNSCVRFCPQQHMSIPLRAENVRKSPPPLAPWSPRDPHTPYPLNVSHSYNEHHPMTSTDSNDHRQIDVGMLCTGGVGGTDERNERRGHRCISD